jgi:glycosyltransferase involved in cell wall biosynthesis
MKIALVGRYPRDVAQIRGGVEAVTLQLSRGLAALPGVYVHVVVPEAGRPAGVERPQPGLTVHSIGGASRLGNLFFALPDRRRIARALRILAPDVVHAHGAHREALGAMESGLPTVVTIHGILEAEIGLERRLGKRVRGIFRRRLVAGALRRMRHVILLSPEVEEHYRAKLRAARTWVIENPVDQRFFDVREPEDPATILFAGVLIPRKGIPNLLEALARLRRDVPSARLRLAGLATHPAHEAEIRETADRLGLADAVAFLGGLAPEELAREVGRAAVFALVSKQETLPVAILEAMAAGKPVVASPVGGVPRVVEEGKTGFLVPYGDPGLLAERLARLLGDAELRRRLGANARREALARFTLESVSRRTLDVYRQVLREARL